MRGSAVAPLVPITLDRERHLRMDFNAVAAAEAATGKNFLAPTAWVTLNVTQMTALLWGCLLHEDPDLTLEAVRGMVDFGNYVEIAAAISAARDASLPTTADQEDASRDDVEVTQSPRPLDRKGRRRGMTSGATPASTSD